MQRLPQIEPYKSNKEAGDEVLENTQESRSENQLRLSRSSRSKTTRYRTSAPLATSCQEVNSFGEWLMPSRLGTKIMAIGAILAICWESCPASLGRSIVVRPSDFAASRTTACRAGSVGAGSVSSTDVQSVTTFSSLSICLNFTW